MSDHLDAGPLPDNTQHTTLTKERNVNYVLFVIIN